MDIFTAIATESFGILQDIILNDSDLNIRDDWKRTPLIASIAISDKTVLNYTVRLLLRYGCDVNAQDRDGRTALMLACMDKDKMDVLEMLTGREDIDLNLKDRDGNTALHHAVDSGNSTAIRQLITTSSGKRKLRLNEVNNAGMTPYRLAGKLQHVRCSRMLIKHGGTDLQTNVEMADTGSNDVTSRKRPGSRRAESKAREILQSEVGERRASRAPSSRPGKPMVSLSREAAPVTDKLPRQNTTNNIIPVTDKVIRQSNNTTSTTITPLMPLNLTDKRPFSKMRPKSEVLPITAFLNPYKPMNRPLSDRRLVSVSHDGQTPRMDAESFPDQSGQLRFHNGSGFPKPFSGYPRAEAVFQGKKSFRLHGLVSNITEHDMPPDAFGEETLDLQPKLEDGRRQRLTNRRALTPIASAKTGREDQRAHSPSHDKPRDRLPSIASGKTMYFATPRETPSELF